MTTQEECVAGNLADTRTHLAYGDEAEGRSWIGHASPARACAGDMSAWEVQTYASLLRDANRSYWDPAWAEQRWGGLLAPPGALMTWSWPLPWVPPGVDAAPPMLAPLVPLPGDRVVNASTHTAFHRPVLVGDRLSVSEVVLDVSRARKTALGEGHFVTTLAEYREAQGHLAASHRNVLLRYRAPAAAGGTAVPAGGHAGGNEENEHDGPVEPLDGLPRAGQRLTPIALDVTLETCVQDVAATRDFLPAHYDPAYALASGAEAPFLNTMFNHGFLDRLCTDWAGPSSRVLARDVRFVSPVLAGRTATAAGTVRKVWHIAEGVTDVDIDAVLLTGGRPAARSLTTLRLSSRDDEDGKP